MLKPTEKWLNSEELKNIYSSEYWNNLEDEKGKPWYILNGDYSQCLNYLKDTGLIDEFEFAEKVIDKINSTNLVVADLAAGIGWTSALFSKKENILLSLYLFFKSIKKENKSFWSIFNCWHKF